MAKALTFTACAVAVGVALYAAAGYVGVPYALRTVVTKMGTEKLGRDVRLESVTFNPWTWVLEIKGLSVPEEGSDPLVALGLLRVDLSSQTLTKLAPVIDEITVDGLKVNAVANDKNRKELEALLGTGEKSASGGSSSTASDKADSSGLPQFAVYNITVANSSLRYRDAAQGIDESLTDLSLKLPFVSTMESSRESLVTPELSMKLNGSTIEATGSTKPFGTSLEAQLNLKVKNLDVARLLRIAPQLRTDMLTLSDATLSSDLTFIFRNPTGGNPAKMLLSGSASLSGVTLEQHGKSIAKFSNASVALKEVDLVAQKAALQSVAVSGLDVRAVNDKSGINLLAAVESLSNSSGKVAAESAEKSSASSDSSSSPWSWSVASAALRDSTISWTDTTVKPTASVTVKKINVSAQNFSSEANASGTFKASLETLGGTLSASGSAALNPMKVSVQAKGSGITLSQVAPYVKGALGADLAASSAFDLKAAYTPEDVSASGTVTVSNLSLKSGKTSLASVKSLSVKLGNLSTAKRTAKVDSVSVTAPEVNAVMTKKGINFAQLGSSTQTAGKVSAGKEGAAKEQSTADGSPWNWELVQASVSDGILRYRDESISPTASVEIPKINLTVKNLSSKSGTQSNMNFSSGLGGGTLAASGSFALSPLAVDVSVKGSSVALKPFSALMQGYAGLGAKSGSLDADGRFGLATKKDVSTASWKGDVSLAKLDLTNAKGTSLMSWTKASLTGMDVETTDPIKIIVAKAEIDQPAQKQTQTIKQVAGIASLLSSLAGKDKTAQKIEKYSEKIPTKISLSNIRYENGKFSAAGVSAASIEGVILQKLSEAVSSKL